MQADARLVEHEQRVDERGAERGGEVDALHLAARQRAALAVERQVAEADVARDTSGACGSRRAAASSASSSGALGSARARRRSGAMRSIGISIRSCTVRPGSASSCARVHCDAARHEALRGLEHRVGVVLACRGATAAPRSSGARRRRPRTACSCGTSTAARGCASCTPCVSRYSKKRLTPYHWLVPVAVPVRRAVDAPSRVLLRRELAPRRVARDAGLSRVRIRSSWHSFQAGVCNVLIAPCAQRLALVGDHEAVVDADHAAEAAAGLAGADRRVEREQRRLRLGVADVAVGAVQAGGEAPDLRLLRLVVGAARRRSRAPRRA